MGHSYYRIHRNAVKSKFLCLSLSRLPGLVHVTQLAPQTPGCIHFTPYISMVKASLEDVIMKGESPGIQLCRLEPDGALGSDGAVVNAVTYFTACLSLGAFFATFVHTHCPQISCLRILEDKRFKESKF